jgi:hypothetical protein
MPGFAGALSLVECLKCLSCCFIVHTRVLLVCCGGFNFVDFHLLLFQ